jgi:hypothetical protein
MHENSTCVLLLVVVRLMNDETGCWCLATAVTYTESPRFGGNASVMFDSKLLIIGVVRQ